MPIFTREYCLICYKEDETNVVGGQTSVQTLNPNSEICRRFCTIASRYYDLDPYFFSPHQTIITKRSFNIDRSCNKCAMKLASFCNIYATLQRYEIELQQQANEILQVMNSADDETSDQYQHRRNLVEKLALRDSTMENADDFRSELKEKIADKKLYPFIQLQKKDIVDRPKSSPTGLEKNGKIPIVEKHTKGKTMSPRKKRMRSMGGSSSSCSSNSSSDSDSVSDSDDSLFQCVEQPKNRPRSREPDNCVSSNLLNTAAPKNICELEKPKIFRPTRRQPDREKIKTGNFYDAVPKTRNLEHEEHEPKIPVKTNDNDQNSEENQIVINLGNSSDDDSIIEIASIEVKGTGQNCENGKLIKSNCILDSVKMQTKAPEAVGENVNSVGSNDIQVNEKKKYLYRCNFIACGKKFESLERYTKHTSRTGHSWPAVILEIRN